jgi:hypothetical protein
LSSGSGQGERGVGVAAGVTMSTGMGVTVGTGVGLVLSPGEGVAINVEAGP